jgi:hypothetical protein
VLASTEEIIFRGIGFKYLIGAGGKAAVLRATVLSSLIFALSHHFQDLQFWLNIGAFWVVRRFIPDRDSAGTRLLDDQLTRLHDRRAQRVDLDCDVEKNRDRSTRAVGLAGEQRVRLARQPSVWLLFILLVVVFWRLRHQMPGVFAIESIDPAAPTAKRSRSPQPIARRGAPLAIGGGRCEARLRCRRGSTPRQIPTGHRYPGRIDRIQTARRRSG